MSKPNSQSKKWLSLESPLKYPEVEMCENITKNGCCKIVPSLTKSVISQKILPSRKIVIVELFHHGQNP